MREVQPNPMHNSNVPRDWDEAYTKLKAIDAAEAFNEADREEISRIETAFKELPAGEDPTDRCLQAALCLAGLRQTRRLGDNCAILFRVLDALRVRKRPAAIVETLAIALLDADLPWQAATALANVAGPLSEGGRLTIGKIERALRIIRADAVVAAPEVQVGLSLLGGRLIDLLGIPPRLTKYTDFDERFDARSPEWQSDNPVAVSPPDTRPLLFALALGEASESLESAESLVHKPALPVPLNAHASTRFRAILQAHAAGIEHLPFQPEDALTVLQLAVFREGIEAGASPLLHRPRDIVRFNNGVMFLFQVQVDEWETMTRALIVLADADGAPRAFAFNAAQGPRPAGEAAYRLLTIVPGGTQHIALSTIVGSGGFLTCRIFDPATYVVWSVADRLVKGDLRVLPMGKTRPPMLIVSFSTGSRRYGDAAQSPSRHRAVVIRYDISARTYEAVGSRRTGTDEMTATNQNLMGISPALQVDEAFDALLSRLGQRSDEYLETGLLKDGGVLSAQVFRVYVQLNNFTAALKVLRQAVAALEDDTNHTNILYTRAWLTLDLARILVYGGDIDVGSTVIALPYLSTAAEQFDDIAIYRYGLTANIALLVGDFASAFSCIEDWRAASGGPTTETESTLARFLISVGNAAGAHEAGLLALDLATRVDPSARNVALDMLSLARSSMLNGRNDESVDWLSRALRLTRSYRGSELTGVALQIAAELAIQEQMPNIAGVLLDQALLAIGETSWESEGASLLYLGADILRDVQALDIADALLSAAVDLARPQRGAAFIAALSARAESAQAQGKINVAIDWAEEAFKAVLAGRSRVGQEAYKVSFVGRADQIGEQYFGMLLERGAPIEEVFDAIEDWRLQIFRDVFASRIELPDAKTGLADLIRELLVSGEAYVAYEVGNKYAFAITLTKDSISLIRLGVTRGELEELINELFKWLDPERADARAYIELGRVPAELAKILCVLHTELVAKLCLSPAIKHLVISPNETLASLPWGALSTPGRPWDALMRQLGQSVLRPLYKQFSVVIVPSARLLLGRRVATDGVATHQKKSILVGALSAVPPERQIETMPVLATPGHTIAALPALQNGLYELGKVADALQDTQVEVFLDRNLLKGQTGFPGASVASRSAVIAAISRASVVHIIGHAMFNAELPMHSALFLDPADGAGCLLAKDLLETDMSSAELIVLSACSTGRNKLSTGAEAFGFLRGLMGANAGTVVLARWPVDDEATSILFGTFYKARRSMGIAEALRLAALEVFGSRPHPFFWAAPALYGWRR